MLKLIYFTFKCSHFNLLVILALNYMYRVLLDDDPTYRVERPQKEGVSVCCLTPNEQFFNYIIERTSYIRWGDNAVCFVLDQHA